MTFSSKELAANGVDSQAVAWRSWRRAQRLTVVECALLTGVSDDAIKAYELGKTRYPRASFVCTLGRLMRDWHEGMRPVRLVGKRGRKPGYSHHGGGTHGDETRR